MAGPDDANCLVLSLTNVPSSLRAGGKDLPFGRAVLTVSNQCGKDALALVLHVSLGQEGGTVQDVSLACAVPAGGTVPAGARLEWDVYDRLLPAHQGTASKIHMFGHRAALNWRFELAAWAEYRTGADFPPSRTRPRRWALRWTVPDPATGAVAIEINEMPD